MTMPIHVLCSNFMEIVGRKVRGETTCYFADKKFAKCVFPALFWGCLAEGANSLQGACHVTLRLPVKFRPNRFRFAGVIAEQVILYDYSMLLA